MKNANLDKFSLTFANVKSTKALTTASARKNGELSTRLAILMTIENCLAKYLISCYFNYDRETRDRFYPLKIS